MFYQVWNSPHAWRKTGKNDAQCSIPVPIYCHPGLLVLNQQDGLVDTYLFKVNNNDTMAMSDDNVLVLF